MTGAFIAGALLAAGVIAIIAGGVGMLAAWRQVIINLERRRRGKKQGRLL